ncbi:MAG: hypothetical protein H0X67_19815 [Acidobacteria bacterium]|nr:hypothetical protein [Acidobacteriota bacterium]
MQEKLILALMWISVVLSIAWLAAHRGPLSPMAVGVTAFACLAVVITSAALDTDTARRWVPVGAALAALLLVAKVFVWLTRS